MDPAGPRAQGCGRTHGSGKRLKSAAGRGEAKIARCDQAGERRPIRKKTLKDSFGRCVQPRRANALGSASGQKITCLFDKSRFGRASGAKQQKIGAARRFERKAQPFGLILGFDQAAARVIGDRVETLSSRSGDRDIAKQPFDIRSDERAERPHQALDPVGAGALSRTGRVFAEDYC